MSYEVNKTRNSECWEGMLFLVGVQGRLFEDKTFEQMDEAKGEALERSREKELYKV